jgi:hypothetical protein
MIDMNTKPHTNPVHKPREYIHLSELLNLLSLIDTKSVVTFFRHSVCLHTGGHTGLVIDAAREVLMQ